MKKIFGGFTIALMCMSHTAHAQMSAGGSTFARRLMDSWTEAYGGSVGGMRYEAVGSSTGVARVKAGELDLAVSDIPLTEAGLKQSNLKQIPLAASGVAVLVNLPELGGKPLRLTGAILADIFLGRIKQWNASTIAGINPDIKLPGRTIVPIWREDGSGQSNVFSAYLSRQDTGWRRGKGTTSELTGLAGRGVRGGAAVLEAVRTTPGAIGYDAFAAQLPAGVTASAMLNASEQYVAPSGASIGEALSKARWGFSHGENAADLDASPGAGSYPLTAVAYAVYPVKPLGTRKPIAPFLERVTAEGDAQIPASGFLRLPANVKSEVQKALR